MGALWERSTQDRASGTSLLDKHLNEPTRLDKNPNKPLDKDSNSLISELRVRIAELEQQVADLQQPFDKTAYQGNYMRRRRAKV